MRLHLIRHARMAGDPFCRPGPGVAGCLSADEGIPQAEALQAALLDCPIDVALASPYGRALQTAEIALRHRAIPITCLDCLVEWQPNPDLADAPSTEFERITSAARHLPPEDTWKTDRGEGCLEFVHRVGPPFQGHLKTLGIHRRHGGWILEPQARDLSIAVFAHGGSLNALAGFLLGLPPTPIGYFSFSLTGTLTLTFTERGGVWYPHVSVAAPIPAATGIPAP